MIPIKTEKEIQIMRESGRALARIMKELEKAVRPGIKAQELEELAQGLIEKTGSQCSFLDYVDPDVKNAKPFPACLCVSINEEIVHGTPLEKILREGDIVSLDLGLYKNGFHVDMAVTLPVGKVNPETARLIRVTKKVLKLAIKKARAGNTFGDVGNTIQRYVESQGYNVVRKLCGHGIGQELHEEPQILNFGKRKTGPEIIEGMVFCLEPMVTIGNFHIKKGSDGFAYKAKDDSLAAHFEHTIAITKKGPQVLTKSNGYDIM